MQYLDFDLHIASSGAPGRYRLEARSPAGEHKIEVHFPFDEAFSASTTRVVEAAFARSASQARDVEIGMGERTEFPEFERLALFGQKLFDLLFTGELLGAYRSSRSTVKRAHKGLRVRLHIDAPELMSLPWEYVYDGAEGDYLCLSRSTPVIRYLDLGQPPQPLAVEPPLRILGVVASPRDLPVLDVAAEKGRIESATRGLQEANRLSLTWMRGQTWRDLLHAMQEGPWHVLHYIGHGDFDANSGEGSIVLADEAGNAHRLSATELGRLLADQASLRLVVLNSCEGCRGSAQDIFSSTAAILMRRGIPAVVAMQRKVTDRAAIEFTRAFYSAAAQGLPVDAGVTEARKAMSLATCNMEWGTPVLHMRAPDGRLFDVGKAPAAAAKPAGQEPRSVDDRARPETGSRVKDALLGLPWKVILFDLTVAALSLTLVRRFVIPENVRPIEIIAALFVVVGFVVTVAHREWIRRKLRWFTVLSLISLILLVLIDQMFVVVEGGDRLLVGVQYTDAGNRRLHELGLEADSDSELIAAIGRDQIAAVWGDSFFVMKGLYSLSYIGFVLGVVVVFGGTQLPHRDRGPP